jgi:hypothetical protein
VVNYDARNSSGHLSGAAVADDLAEFFKTLVGKQKESLNSLLSAYAKQDAAAVFRLAEIFKLDLAVDFPPVIINNCDQFPFFSLIKEQALREPGRLRLWSSLLSEAALRSPVVAKWLYETPRVHALDDSLNDTPRHQAWCRAAKLKKSFYGQVLTMASGESRPASLLVSYLKRIPPPGFPQGFYVTGLLFISLFIGDMLSVTFLEYTLLYFEFLGRSNPYVVPFVGLSLGIMSFYFFKRHHQRDRVYAMLLNLPTGDGLQGRPGDGGRKLLNLPRDLTAFSSKQQRLIEGFIKARESRNPRRN